MLVTAFAIGRRSDLLPHFGVGEDVVVFGVIHDAELAVAEGLGDGERDLGFCFDDASAHFLGAGGHFLLEGDGGGAAHFGVGLGDFFVGLGLLGLEFGADVVTDIDIGDVDGENLEGGAGIDAFAENELGDGVGIFEHVFVAIGGADAGDDAFADTGDDGFFGGTADEALEVGADGDAGTDAEGDAVFGDGVDLAATAHLRVGAVDDFGVDAGADGFDDGFAGAFDGEVDGASAVEIQRDAGFVCGDEGKDDLGDVATSEVMGLKGIGENRNAGLGRSDAGVHDQGIRHAAQPHGDEGGDADRGVGDACSEPDIEEFADDEQQDECENEGDGDEEEL